MPSFSKWPNAWVWREGKWEGTSLPWDLEPQARAWEPSRVLLTALHRSLSGRGFLGESWCSDQMSAWYNPRLDRLTSHIRTLFKGTSSQNAVDWKTHRTVCSQLVPLLLCVPTMVGGGAVVMQCPRALTGNRSSPQWQLLRSWKLEVGITKRGAFRGGVLCSPLEAGLPLALGPWVRGRGADGAPEGDLSCLSRGLLSAPSSPAPCPRSH